MTDFDALVRACIDEAFALDPLEATNAGIHLHDHRWPDWTDAGRRERIAFAERWLSTFRRLDATALSSAEAIDRDRMVLELEARRYVDADLREDAWSPLIWIYRVGDGLFTLLSREFAPPAVRLASAAGRMEGLPAVLDAGRDVLGTAPGVPVARFHVEIALRDLPGLTSLVEEALDLAAAHPGDPEVVALRPRLAAAAQAARAAIEAFGRHLDAVVRPASKGEGRLGKARFDAKLAHVYSDPSMTAERILALAEGQYGAVRGEMVRIARAEWRRWKGDTPEPQDDGDAVRQVIAAISLDHPAADALLDVCRSELVGIETFCRDRDVIGLAEEPLVIQWTPVFLRSFAGAMLHSPGPFDAGEKAFFSITPPAAEWPPERVESMLREHNIRQLRLLTIHEAVPGHYLQGVYGNRVDSLARKVFGDGVYAEGWAVYVTQVMLDLGYDGGDPATWLIHWKYYLRAVVNAIIDVRIHTLGMTKREAIDLMVDGAFQEHAEATGKYARARLSSTQLSSYFIGSAGMWAIEDEVRRRAAEAAGAGRDAVPEPAIVGGYGETPGFRYRAHLEAVVGAGKLPLPLLRRVMLGT